MSAKKPSRRRVKRRPLSRRAFLGGAGAAIALPYLEAMTPIGRPVSAQMDSATRLVFVYVPNGIIRTRMTPTSAGADYAMTPLLRPIEPLRNKISVLSGLSNHPGGGRYTYPDGTESNDGPGDHARDTGTFLTARRLKKTDGSDIENGISVDQVAANYQRLYTPVIPSLVLATRPGSYGGDSGYAPIYKANISWADTTTPVAKEVSPRATFERLFAGFDTGESEAERVRRIALETSVLDSCLDDMRSLQAQLGARDRVKLDGYLSGIRQLETRLEEDEVRSCDPGTAPPADLGFLQTVDHMFEVIKLAFACDRTRVVSLILDKGGTYDFLSADGAPISQAHHQMTHLEAGMADVRKVEAINAWQIEQFANLCTRLNDTEDDTGSLLDNSLVLFGGGLDGTGHGSGDPLGDLTPRASGPVHRHTNLPLLLGGGGRGAVRPGRHIVYNRREPIADLYVSMLHAIGHRVDGFGLEGTGPLEGLT